MTHRARSIPLVAAADPPRPEYPALPDGVVPVSEPLAALLAPLLSVDDLARTLNASRRTIERMRSAGKLPRPDLLIGKMPRWKQSTIREWLDEQSRKGVAK
jgi:excisionase family DNA binding protein